MRRPRLLVRAAQRRPSDGKGFNAAVEAVMEQLRRDGSPHYEPVKHMEMLARLIGPGGEMARRADGEDRKA